MPRCAAVLIRSNSVSFPAASLSTRQVSDLRLRNEFSGLCFLIHYNPVITSPVYKPSLYNPTVPATVRVPHPKPDTPAPFKRSFLGIVYLQRRAAKRTNIGKGQQFLSFVLSTARFQACRITLPLFPPPPLSPPPPLNAGTSRGERDRKIVLTFNTSVDRCPVSFLTEEYLLLIITLVETF